jgi:hypothetical protein
MSYQQEYQQEDQNYAQVPTGGYVDPQNNLGQQPAVTDPTTGDVEAQKPTSRSQELLENLGGVIAVLFGASLVVLLQAAIWCDNCEGKEAYTVAVGAVSGIITLIYLMMARYNRLPSNGRFVLAVFMFIWWTIGAGVLTFPGGMFQFTGNGYFGAWGAWCCSAWLMKTEYGRLQSLVDRFSELGMVSWLLLTSIVELCAAIANCDQGYSACKDYDAFALAAGLVSVVITLTIIFVPALTTHIKIIAAFLVVWWIAGAGVNTFKGPFQVTGNGFFSSWACVIASVFMLQPHMGW